jgi:hypothetical protein
VIELKSKVNVSFFLLTIPIINWIELRLNIGHVKSCDQRRALFGPNHSNVYFGRTMRITGVFFLVASLFAACSDGNKTAVFPLERLQGTWEFNNGETRQIEEWNVLSENELRGRGYVLDFGDTTFIEFLHIKVDNGVLTYYTGTSDEVVPFQLKRQNEKEIEFSNPEFGFPKRIVYNLLSDTSLLAFVEGPKDGEDIRVDFHFIKKKS